MFLPVGLGGLEAGYLCRTINFRLLHMIKLLLDSDQDAASERFSKSTFSRHLCFAFQCLLDAHEISYHLIRQPSEWSSLGPSCDGGHRHELDQVLFPVSFPSIFI